MAKKKSRNRSRSAATLPSVQDAFEKAFPGGFSLRDEANSIVAFALRNGPIEDLHAGEWSKLLERDGLSRITDEEMKVLVIFACEKIELLLRLKEREPEKYKQFIMANGAFYCSRWER